MYCAVQANNVTVLVEEALCYEEAATHFLTKKLAPRTGTPEADLSIAERRGLLKALAMSTKMRDAVDPVECLYVDARPTLLTSLFGLLASFLSVEAIALAQFYNADGAPGGFVVS